MQVLESSCIEPSITNKIEYDNYFKKCAKASRLKREISSVNVAFNLLTKDERNILYLAYWKQVPIPQIRTMYHIGNTTIHRWINRAINKINNVMGDLA
ncbi:hypothetical protein ACJDU8_22660 [Clostridium sp. WILCCON 0269]|uniref:RNA polymerase sigma factor 70 region 4 type 2 domain-containing protein n=1 Tax=Candidatus Clostridium eludens TaxID=3381663 RepID=A0ABW8SQM9_9CLOT